MEEDLFQALDALGYSVVWGAFEDGEGFPRITLQQISNLKAYHLTGRSGNQGARVQINIYAETYLAVRDTANEVAATLEALSHSGSIIRCSEISRRSNTSETGGDVVQLMQLDFMVQYRA